MEPFNLNEPILLGPGKLTASVRFWRWLQQFGGAPQWQTPTLSPNVAYYGAPYSPPGYYIDLSGRVRLRGLVTGTGLTVVSTIFTLPAGFRPVNQHLLFAVGYTGSAYGIWRVDVYENGSVNIIAAVSGSGNPTGWLSLDSISFSTY